MKLPNNSIGISDIMGYRECPQRFAFGMRRHIELPERLQLEPGEKDEPPEATNWTNAYGSAIHHAIHLVDKEGVTHSEAIHQTMLLYGNYLEPDHIDLLREDLSLFDRRRPLGVTLVGSEMELRVPLFVHETEGQIYFRCRIDALHRLIANPSIFLHRDYKSSAWRKTPPEVHNDPQLWSYSWAIHEWFPECVQLHQTYDQLRFGEVPTSKNDAQRATIKQWLIENVRVIMADETYKPKQNDFCRYCLPAGALVATDDGPQPIEGIVEGAQVVTHRGRLGVVRATASRNAEELCLLTTSGGHEIKATPEHPILATPRDSISHILKSRLSAAARADFPPPGYVSLRGLGRGLWFDWRHARKAATWVDAGDVAPGDLLWGRLPPERPISLTTEELKLLGWYLAEGSAGGRTTSFALHAEERAYQGEIKGLLQTVFGAKHIAETETGNRYQCHVHSAHIAAWFLYFGGRGAADKRVHPLAFSPRALLPLALAAWRGDGTEPHPERTQMSYVTTSRCWAYQLQAILLKNGVATHFATRTAHPYGATARRGWKRDAFHLVASGEAATRLSRLLDSECATGAYTKAPSLIYHDGWVLQTVTSACREKGTVRVYDITVPGDESFVLPSHVAVHNCALVVTCRETQRATDYWKGRLALTAPLTKEGRKVRVAFQAEGEELERIVREELPKMQGTRKHIAHVEDVLKDLLKDMSTEDRERLGWRLRDRRTKTITADGLRELHALLGDEFYSLLSLPMSRLEEHVGGKPKKGEPVPPELEIAKAWQTEEVIGTNLVPTHEE